MNMIICWSNRVDEAFHYLSSSFAVLEVEFSQIRIEGYKAAGDEVKLCLVSEHTNLPLPSPSTSSKNTGVQSFSNATTHKEVIHLLQSVNVGVRLYTRVYGNAS